MLMNRHRKKLQNKKVHLQQLVFLHLIRDRPIEENLTLFENMNTAETVEGSMVLRAKLDMSNPNMHFRDPIMYRIIQIPHHRTGTKWHCYPMYDFAHPIEDAIERITHPYRTLEFEVHRPLYNWVLEDWEDTENLAKSSSLV